jgi:protease I
MYNRRMSSPGQSVAILVEDGFDDQELTGLIDGLTTAGLDVVLVGPVAGRTYTGRHGHATVTSHIAPGAARARTFAAIAIPGGYAPDRIRMRHGLVDLVRDAVSAGRVVAAMGHGAQVLISALAVSGRTLTCWPSIAVDLTNAGALYVDRPVVEDGSIVTARKADDLPQFLVAILHAIDARGAG